MNLNEIRPPVIKLLTGIGMGIGLLIRLGISFLPAWIWGYWLFTSGISPTSPLWFAAIVFSAVPVMGITFIWDYYFLRKFKYTQWMFEHPNEKSEVGK